MIGKTLSHFRILAKIGEGGMGIVYRAEDEKLRRPVAMKVLPPDLIADEERRLRFLREARAAAAITHPDIATVYEIGEAEDSVFIAMELVEGKSLRSLIEHRLLSVKEALRIALEISEGLSRAHQAHVIHRDLKPDNILIAADQHVKILDFGLAKLLEGPDESGSSELSRLKTISGEMTREGKIFGTAAYMSPEQARGLPVDARSDLFSFGVVLYEMVTGKTPFQGKTSTDMLSSIIRDEPVPPSQLNPDVPPKLEEIVGKCLEKDPTDRYQHADELAVDLRKLKRTTESGVQAVRTPSGPLAAPPSGVLQRLRVSRPAKLALAAGVGVLIVAAAIVGWREIHSAGKFRLSDRVIVADFENLTGRPEFDTAVRDIFEERLAKSTFLDVLTGERLKELMGGGSGGAATRVSGDVAKEICGKGGCAGYLVGRIAPEGSGYRLEANLQQTAHGRPQVPVAAVAASEQEIVKTIHDLALDLRRAVGESPQSVAATWAPTTRSVRAYQAFAIASRADNPLSLYRQALEIDPDFVDAYSGLALAHANSGDGREYRRLAEEAYRRSSGLPEEVRLWKEIDYLDARYDFDAELDRLKTYQQRYPFNADAAIYLAWLYSTVYEDFALAERAGRSAYRLLPNEGNFGRVVNSLAAQGKAEEIERMVADFRSKGGAERDAVAGTMRVFLLRGDRRGLEESVRRLREEPGGIAPYGGLFPLIDTLMRQGRWDEAEKELAALWRAVAQIPSADNRVDVGLKQAWLESRLRGKPATLSAELLEDARKSLLTLPGLAKFCVDARLADPLARVIQEHEAAEKGSKSRFVREEIQFARGCLALARGRNEEARTLLEPITRNSTLARRHRMLGRTYEALGMWRDSAAEYERCLEALRPGWGSTSDFSDVLDQFRLAQIYYRLNDRERARRWYGLFLEDWKDADPGIPELVEARQRSATLNRIGAESPASGAP